MSEGGKSRATFQRAKFVTGGSSISALGSGWADAHAMYQVETLTGSAAVRAKRRKVDIPVIDSCIARGNAVA